jgi:hypothetical protein
VLLPAHTLSFCCSLLPLLLLVSSDRQPSTCPMLQLLASAVFMCLLQLQLLLS